MQTQAENKLNRLRYYLSPEAKKRLKWIYVIEYKCDNNISLAANKIGVSRTWLSQINSKWKNSHRDPRSLEPESRVPRNTDNRKRIDGKVENKIIELRKKYHPWGKDKLSKKHQTLNPLLLKQEIDRMISEIFKLQKHYGDPNFMRQSE